MNSTAAGPAPWMQHRKNTILLNICPIYSTARRSIMHDYARRSIMHDYIISTKINYAWLCYQRKKSSAEWCLKIINTAHKTAAYLSLHCILAISTELLLLQTFAPRPGSKALKLVANYCIAMSTQPPTVYPFFFNIFLNNIKRYSHSA